MAIATAYGTGTLNSTLGGGGVTPSVTITATVTDTSNNLTVPSIRSPPVEDVRGSIGISATRLNDTTVQVSADRQLPAGKEIVFDWLHLDGVA